jgi:hypothetical protein
MSLLDYNQDPEKKDWNIRWSKEGCSSLSFASLVDSQGMLILYQEILSPFLREKDKG